MKFAIASPYAVLSILSFTNIGQAAPVDTATQSAAPAHALMRRDNHCGPSVFVNESSGGSPLIADCEILRSNIVGDGTWTMWGGGVVAKYGTCAFQTYQGGYFDVYYIGNEDIRDLIRDAIEKFGWFEFVGASGTMDCDTEGSPQRWTHWQLVHT